MQANRDKNNISTNPSSNNAASNNEEVEVDSFIAQITAEPLSNKTMHQLAKILSGWKGGDLIVRKIQDYIKAHSGEKNTAVKNALDRSDIINNAMKRLENLGKETRGEHFEKIQAAHLLGSIILQLSLVGRSKESIDYALGCLAELIVKGKPVVIAIELYQLLLERTNNEKDKAAIMIELSDCYDGQNQYIEAYNVLEKAGRIDHSETQQKRMSALKKNGGMALHRACLTGNFDEVKKLLSFDHIKPHPGLIISAVHSKSIDMVKYIDSLLDSEQIPYVDDCGWNAVHYAAQANAVGMLKYFNEHPKRDALFNAITGKGWFNGKETVFIAAARYKAHNAIEYLANLLPNQLNTVDQNNKNALIWAYQNKDIKLFELLIQLEANPNRDYRPATSCWMLIFGTIDLPDLILHKICSDEALPYLRILLKSRIKVDVDEPNNNKKSAMDIAQERAGLNNATNEAKEILNLLQQYCDNRLGLEYANRH